MYKSPTSIKEYWSIVDVYWKDIFHILNLYLPTFNNKWIDGTELPKTLGEFLLELKESRNPRLVRAFNAAWFNAPDDVGDCSHPSWDKFYDLCREEWCLIEEKESL